MFIHEIWGKFQKRELGKFIPNFPLKHVITSRNLSVVWFLKDKIRFPGVDFSNNFKHSRQKV